MTSSSLRTIPVMWLLGAGMLGLGLGVGAVFPGFAVLLGVPTEYVANGAFRWACLGAGLLLAGANWCLVRCIVGRRLRRLSAALGEVADHVRRDSVRLGDDPRDSIGALRLPSGARDHLGAAAEAFNALLDSLERERRFRAVLHASRDVTVLVDTLGRIGFASSSVRSVLGWDPKDILGTAVLNAVHPADHDLLRRLFEQAAPEAAARPDGFPMSREPVVVRIATEDGGSRLLEVSISDHRHDPALAALVLTGRDVTERVHLQDELATQALQDPLTGLPNRAALLQRAERLHAAGPDRPVSVALMDLNRFKEVNDTLGHDYGDKLLAQVGPRLQAQMRPDDLLVRLGGDEFAVLMDGLDVTAALGVARRARAALQRPFDVDGMLLEVDASIGVASRTPTSTSTSTSDTGTSDTSTPDSSIAAQREGASIHDLLRMADVAMYTAKELQSGVEQYDPGTDGNDRSRLSLLTELRRGLARGELVLHYQPKLFLRDGALAGVEALVRWQHPQRGLLAPGDFLPAVELTGLIWPLTLEVLDQALTQAKAWQLAGHDVPVAVNLSARCLHRADLAGTILDRLRVHDVPAARLRLELTESALMAEPDRALQHLNDLAHAGVRLSIDDFGTGYSSMSYLRRLPVDELKVDRSFVADIANGRRDDVLIRSIVDLGHSLGLTIVAEGVEEGDTHTALQGLHCDIGQGYHYARPQPAHTLTHWLTMRVATATDSRLDGAAPEGARGP